MESRPHRQGITVEELERLPDDEYRYELEAGVLVREPAPGARHAVIGGRLAGLLHEHVKAVPGAVVLTEAAFVLAREPDTVRVPDLAVVRVERVRVLADWRRPFSGAPELAVEIVSPSNQRWAIRSKVAEYLSAGTEVVWVVDPDAETVTTFRSLFTPVAAGTDETLDGGSVLPGLSIRCGALFGLP